MQFHCHAISALNGPHSLPAASTAAAAAAAAHRRPRVRLPITPDPVLRTAIGFNARLEPTDKVSGLNRVPNPPTRMSAFILSTQRARVATAITCPLLPLCLFSIIKKKYRHNWNQMAHSTTRSTRSTRRNHVGTHCTFFSSSSSVSVSLSLSLSLSPLKQRRSLPLSLFSLSLCLSLRLAPPPRCYLQKPPWIQL